MVCTVAREINESEPRIVIGMPVLIKEIRKFLEYEYYAVWDFYFKKNMTHKVKAFCGLFIWCVANNDRWLQIGILERVTVKQL